VIGGPASLRGATVRRDDAVFARGRPATGFRGAAGIGARLSRHADERNFALIRPLEWIRVDPRNHRAWKPQLSQPA